MGKNKPLAKPKKYLGSIEYVYPISLAREADFPLI
jgi:hypothetical protein